MDRRSLLSLFTWLPFLGSAVRDNKPPVSVGTETVSGIVTIHFVGDLPNGKQRVLHCDGQFSTLTEKAEVVRMAGELFNAMMGDA